MERAGKIPTIPPPKGKRKRKTDPNVIFQGRGGDWLLSTIEKKRILLNNIHGVDIDHQAVEVTKLSLLLKVLENENQDTLNRQLTLWRERALPDLGNNIKCGNSLVGPDFYDKMGPSSLFADEETVYRVNIFDWKDKLDGFGEIMDAGGFDVILGNPPYIPIELMSDYEKTYYQRVFPQLERKYDSSIVFIIALLQKLSPQGRLGYISSLTWQTGENYKRLRELLFESYGVERIVNLPFDVFKSAYVDTGVYVLTSFSQPAYDIFRFPKKAKINSLDGLAYTTVERKLIKAPDYKIILNPVSQLIFNRASNRDDFEYLGEFTISTQGLATSRFKRTEYPSEIETCYSFLEKGQVYRYRLEVDAISYADMSDKQSLRRFYENEPKLLIRRVINRQDRLMATFFDEKMVFKKDLNPFIVTSSAYDAKFVLGVINSRLISYLYVNSSSIATKDDFRQTTLAELRRLPIPRCDEENQEKLVLLVDSMLVLNKKLQEANIPDTKNHIERQITVVDRQIDNLVYELYELTTEEINAVEEAVQ